MIFVKVTYWFTFYEHFEYLLSPHKAYWACVSDDSLCRACYKLQFNVGYVHVKLQFNKTVPLVSTSVLDYRSTYTIYRMKRLSGTNFNLENNLPTFFNWMLQLSSGQKCRGTNKHCYLQPCTTEGTHHWRSKVGQHSAETLASYFPSSSW